MATLRNAASATKAAGKKTALAKAARGAGPRAARATAAPADSVVVYVHGIGAKPPKPELKLQWDLALFGRDLGDRSRMAYWADLRRPTAAADSAAPASGVKRARDAKATLDVEALLPPKAGETEHLFAVRLLQYFGTQVVADEAGPAAQGPRKKLLPLPAWARRPINVEDTYRRAHQCLA